MELDFCGEKAECARVNSFNDLLDKIKSEFLLSDAELNGLSLQFQNENGEQLPLNTMTIKDFLSQNRLIVFIECTESSKIFQDCYENQIKSEKNEEQISQVLSNAQKSLQLLKECYKEEKKEEVPSIESIVSDKVQSAEKEIIKSFNTEVLKASEILYYSKANNKVKAKKIALAEHTGICCDHCKQFPIRGVRYKCLICTSYDLCEDCEEKEKHKHPMAKLQLPIV